jgi:hypothetical protein
MRERIAKVEEAPQRSFAVGRFAVICEDETGAPAHDETWRAPAATRAGVAQGDMLLCAACDQFFYTRSPASRSRRRFCIEALLLRVRFCTGESSRFTCSLRLAKRSLNNRA